MWEFWAYSPKMIGTLSTETLLHSAGHPGILAPVGVDMDIIKIKVQPRKKSKGNFLNRGTPTG